MGHEITHKPDEKGVYRQIVSPERLREILDEDGSSHSRPKDFQPQDEWDVGEHDEMETVIDQIVSAAKEIADTDSEFNALDDFYSFMGVMWSDEDRKRHGLNSVEYQDAMQSAWHRSDLWRFKPSHYLEGRVNAKIRALSDQGTKL